MIWSPKRKKKSMATVGNNCHSGTTVGLVRNEWETLRSGFD